MSAPEGENRVRTMSATWRAWMEASFWPFEIDTEVRLRRRVDTGLTGGFYEPVFSILKTAYAQFARS